ncbi:MAG TPA: cell wall-binding protein [Methanothermococcus okinawensis]|uniref:Cell wall-binding protein n=1 Tax=Methanothermococcus okinawensis TaxID=155863 RepID=A0A832Z8J7_9EURY|nr:cell wall-binding protein [Methanothermococcus okinawensis]
MEWKYIIIFLLLLNGVEALVIGEEKPSLVDTVFVTNNRWPDCIAATDYGYEVDGVILQTYSNYLDPSVESLIEGIAPKRIVIVGGPLAVSYSVEERLKKYGDVVRVWGPTRVETREEILKMIEREERIVLVNGSNFKDAVDVISRDYAPAYCFINVYDPYQVMRVYRDDGIVELYYVKNRRLIGKYPRRYVLELPGKIVVLSRCPDMDIEFTNNQYIAKFGYKLIDLGNTSFNSPCGYTVVVNENTPSGVLLSKYLDIPVVYNSEIPRGDKVIKFENDPINSSITVTVDILVLKRTVELYKRNRDLKQSLYEAKTQLWSKNIPVERYNIPYSCLEKYIEKMEY